MTLNKNLVKAIYNIDKQIKGISDVTVDYNENKDMVWLSYDNVFECDIGLMIQIIKDCELNFYSYSFYADNGIVITIKVD